MHVWHIQRSYYKNVEHQSSAECMKRLHIRIYSARLLKMLLFSLLTYIGWLDGFHIFVLYDTQLFLLLVWIQMIAVWLPLDIHIWKIPSTWKRRYEKQRVEKKYVCCSFWWFFIAKNWAKRIEMRFIHLCIIASRRGKKMSSMTTRYIPFHTFFAWFFYSFISLRTIHALTSIYERNLLICPCFIFCVYGSAVEPIATAQN